MEKMTKAEEETKQMGCKNSLFWLSEAMATLQISQFTGTRQHFQLELDLVDKTTLWTLLPSVL